MRPKSMVLILIALGCGLLASIGISQVMEGRGQGIMEAIETKEIYVAMSDIAVGTPLTPKMVKLEAWPSDRVPVGAVTKLENLEGKMPKTPLFSGECILDAKLSNNLGGTGERIPKGYRVMSVKVSMSSGVSGLILPGDRVDVMVFLKRSGEISQTGTRTILRDVRIFAVNDQINRETNADGSVSNVKTVSLSVKPEQVERLMLAAELGRLRLALRRADDETESDTDGATVADLSDTQEGDGGHSENPDNRDDPPKDTSESDSFLGFLDRMRQNAALSADNTLAAVNPAAVLAPVQQPPVATMQIHTANGVSTFNWHDKASLPVEMAELNLKAVGGQGASSAEVSQALDEVAEANDDGDMDPLGGEDIDDIFETNLQDGELDQEADDLGGGSEDADELTALDE